MENMAGRRMMALVEDAEVARTALRWAVHNIFRVGDAITLLHVYPGTRSRNKEKQRKRRRKGFQLALAFKDLCQDMPQVTIYIIWLHWLIQSCFWSILSFQDHTIYYWWSVCRWKWRSLSWKGSKGKQSYHWLKKRALLCLFLGFMNKVLFTGKRLLFAIQSVCSLVRRW